MKFFTHHTNLIRCQQPLILNSKKLFHFFKTYYLRCILYATITFITAALALAAMCYALHHPLKMHRVDRLFETPPIPIKIAADNNNALPLARLQAQIMQIKVALTTYANVTDTKLRDLQSSMTHSAILALMPVNVII